MVNAVLSTQNKKLKQETRNVAVNTVVHLRSRPLGLEESKISASLIGSCWKIRTRPRLLSVEELEPGELRDGATRNYNSLILLSKGFGEGKVKGGRRLSYASLTRKLAVTCLRYKRDCTKWVAGANSTNLLVLATITTNIWS